MLNRVLIKINKGILFFTIMLLSNFIFAGNGEWTTHGPYGGNINCIKIDPNNVNIIYAGTNQGGIFKSTNEGESWVAINDGITTPLSSLYATVDKIDIAPTNSNILFAAVDGDLSRILFKSTNAGATWQTANVGLFGGKNICNIAVSPLNEDTLYVTFDRNYAPSLYKSVNGGASWDSVAITGSVYSILINKTDPEMLYAGMTGGGVQKSFNGGLNWAPTGLTSKNIKVLVADPEEPDIIYAGASDGGIYKTADGGVNWNLLGLEAQQINDITVCQDEPRLIYAAAKEGIFMSMDAGESWEQVSSCSTHLSIAAIGFGQGYKVFAGCEQVGGIYITTDFGNSWTASNTGITALSVRYVNFDPENKNNIYVGTSGFSLSVTEGGGILKSTDAGVTWQEINSGLPVNSIAMSGAINPSNKLEMFTGVSSSQGTGLYKTTNGGESWFQAGLTNKYIWAITIDTTNPEIIYAAAYMDDIYKSTDGGGTWTATGVGETPVVVNIIIDPLDPSVIYAVNYQFRLICKSTNAGGNWTESTSPAGTPWSLAVRPDNSSIIYVGGFRGIYKSLDGGVTYNITSLGAESGTGAVINSIIIDPVNHDIMYAAGANGESFWAGKVWKSTNAGEDWSEFNTGLPDNTVARSMVVTYNPAHTARTLYLCGQTYGCGLYSYTESVASAVADDNQTPMEYMLEQNYPNPFNPSTTINFSLLEDSRVTLKVYNTIGEEVAVILNGSLPSGRQSISFNAASLPSGVYLYKIEANGNNGTNFTSVKKMLLLK